MQMGHPLTIAMVEPVVEEDHAIFPGLEHRVMP
jgi:hypothetical protein